MFTINQPETLEFSKVLSFIRKYAETDLGKERIERLYPLDSIDEIVRQGTFVDEAKNALIETGIPPLEPLENCDRQLSLAAIDDAILQPKQLLQISKLAAVSRKFFDYLKEHAELFPTLKELGNYLFVDKLFEHKVSAIIDLNGDVKDNASKTLKTIRKDMRDKGEELRKMVAKITKSLAADDIVREDYMTLRDGRMVIPVKVEHKRHIRGFIHSESATGQTVYIEPEATLNLNNDIISLSFAEKREIERLLKEVTAAVGQRSEELRGALTTLAILDSVFARAHYSIEVIGAFPTFNESKKISVLQAYHPLLLQKSGRKNTIPFSIEISDDNRVTIITGPNAGGKTVVLKSIGLLTLMVHSGIHIPASPDSNYHFFDSVLMDIGDAQSIEDDLSTFSSHLSNIRSIIEKSTEQTLVLLDEIGTGTDPSAGAALAAATLLFLKQKNSVVIATTHHGNLKLIANELEGFENASMEFDQENLRPTYHFRQGLPGSSYAFEIAKRIGFKDDFFAVAKEYLNTDEDAIENILIDIERRSNALKDKLAAVELENIRLKGLSNVYRKKIDTLEKEKKEILKRTKREADEYLDSANKDIQRVIKEIKEKQADRESVKESQNTLQTLKNRQQDFSKKTVDKTDKKYHFNEGDFVRLKESTSAGKILHIDKQKKYATVQTGSIKLQASLNELIPADLSEKQETDTGSGYFSYTQELPELRLDIRGSRPEEIEFPVVRFIDNAFSGGIRKVEILHGKGGGVLRKAVGKILKEHEKVKEYYPAPIEAGGEGITIAELK